ncbi:metallophosphoesterase family protein [Sinomonas sp. RB5]
MKIAVAGDWHGHGRWARAAVGAAADAGAEAMIHVGDLGAFWGDDWIHDLPELGVSGFTGVLADAVAAAGIPFYFVDGNHDDHENLALLPRSSAGLAEAHGLTYLPRGSRLELGGRTFGALGGRSPSTGRT